MLLDRYPRQAQLKDGSVVTIRPMTRQDEGVLTDFFAAFNEEDRLYLRNDVSSTATVRSWIQNLDYRRVFPILALSEGRVVANGTLHRKPFNWMRHLGEVRVAVVPEWRRRGLARLMAEELIANAAAEGLAKITAEVVVNQKDALKVFNSLGFTKEATLKGFVLDGRGEARDLVIMTLKTGD